MDKKNQILLLLTDKWCDWEASYAIAVAHSFSEYEVKTVAIDKKPKISMGNLSVNVDYSIIDYNDFSNVAMIVLPGGLSWEENEYNEIAEFIRAIAHDNIPVAAICGATTFLCKHGFLDSIKHTGDSLELFQSQKGYNGHGYYIMQKVEDLSEGKVRIAAGTMYGAIDNLLKQKLIQSMPSEDTRRKVYQITELGREVLRLETSRLRYLVKIAEENRL